MEIKIPKQQLLEALELVSRVSTRHVSLPVLQCVLLKVEKGSVSLKATNLEIGIEVKLPIDTEATVSIAVAANIFLQTVQFLQQDEVTIRIEEGLLVVVTKNTETTIKGVPHDEFPSIPKVSGGGQKVNRAQIILGIKSVAFAASQSSIKPELGSVYVGQKKEHTLTFAATDSFRLMEKTTSQKNVVLEEPVLIPFKNALELARVCEQKTTDPTLTVNENQLALGFEDGTYIISRLVSGTYPDYEGIIPKEFITKATLLKEDLVHSLKQSSVFLNKFFQVSLSVTKQGLTITANNGDVGTTTKSISASVEGEELTLSFNQRYITDPLAHFAGDSLELHFAGIGRPLVVKNPSDSSLRYLIMPMNR